MDAIFTTEQFRTAAIIVAHRQHDWKPADFMKILHNRIVYSMGQGEVHDGVFILYFTLHKSLSGRSVARTKIISSLDKIQWI